MRSDARQCGMLLLNKPSGMTSHQAVIWARRRLGISRVGHAGTLDPLAEGLLPLLLGPATRLVRFLHEWDKRYAGMIRLGIESASDDGELAPADLRAVPLPAPELLRAAQDRLSGSYLQQPPAFSAKKIGGIPAYRSARRGQPLPLIPASITVHRLRLVPAAEARILFAARVSSGTYLRALARDLGRILGTGAYLERLRRSGIGPLAAHDAIAIDDLISSEELLSCVIPLEQIPLPLPAVRLPSLEIPLFRAGHRVAAGATIRDESSFVRILASDGPLLGIAEQDGGPGLQPRVVFPQQDQER